LVTLAAVALAVAIAGGGFVAGLMVSTSLAAPSRALWLAGVVLWAVALARGLWHVRRRRLAGGPGMGAMRAWLVDGALWLLLLAGLALWLAGVRA